MIKAEDVASVYSGKAGKCCCGCAGKHTIASRHRDWAEANRGYEVTAEEVNDAVVKRVINKLNQNPLTSVDDELAHVVIGNRLYVAYFNTDLLK